MPSKSASNDEAPTTKGSDGGVGNPVDGEGSTPPVATPSTVTYLVTASFGDLQAGDLLTINPAQASELDRAAINGGILRKYDGV